MSRPSEASEWPPRSSAVDSPKWVQRPTTSEGMDGADGVHFLNYPIHLNFKLPRGFTSASRLNYWF